MKSQSSSTDIKRAEAALQVGRYKVAETLARSILQFEPQNAEALTVLARALLRLERYEEAADSAKAALARCPQSAFLHRLYAAIMINLGQAKEALESVETSLRLDPTESYAHFVRSRALQLLGHYDEAIEAAQTALEADPMSVHALDQLAGLHLDHNPELAEDYYRKALEIDPNDVVSLNNLGVAMQAQGKVVEASSVFESVVRIDPTFGTGKKNVLKSARKIKEDVEDAFIDKWGVKVFFGSVLVFCLIFPEPQGESSELISAVASWLMLFGSCAVCLWLGNRKFRSEYPDLCELSETVEAHEPDLLDVTLGTDSQLTLDEAPLPPWWGFIVLSLLGSGIAWVLGSGFGYFALYFVDYMAACFWAGLAAVGFYWLFWLAQCAHLRTMFISSALLLLITFFASYTALMHESESFIARHMREEKIAGDQQASRIGLLKYRSAELDRIVGLRYFSGYSLDTLRYRAHFGSRHERSRAAIGQSRYFVRRGWWVWIAWVFQLGLFSLCSVLGALVGAGAVAEKIEEQSSN